MVNVCSLGIIMLLPVGDYYAVAGWRPMDEFVVGGGF